MLQHKRAQKRSESDEKPRKREILRAAVDWLLGYSVSGAVRWALDKLIG